MTVLPSRTPGSMPWSRFVSDPRDPDRDSRELSLAAVPHAAGAARRFAAALLRAWELVVLTDDCEVVISELVTNSVCALGSRALSEGGSAVHDGPRPDIVLRLRLTGLRLVCEVWDPSPAMPAEAMADLLDESGRGMMLVGSLADHWSCYPSPAGGKVVNASWPLSRQPSSAHHS